MAVKLRLRRLGRKKRPFYRIVAADSRAPRDGRFIEEIGEYNPLTNPATVSVQEDRVMYWLGVGATPSKTVKNILSNQGIILKHDLQKSGVPEEKITEELKKWEVLQLEKARRKEARKQAEQEKKAKAKEEEPEAEAPAAAADTEKAPQAVETPSEQPDATPEIKEEEKTESSETTSKEEKEEVTEESEQAEKKESSENTEEKIEGEITETSEEEKTSQEEQTKEDEEKKS